MTEKQPRVAKTATEIIECRLAQKALCKAKGYPHFAPEDGRCFRCGKNIYQNYDHSGVSLERAGRELITGCPHCNRSYCD